MERHNHLARDVYALIMVSLLILNFENFFPLEDIIVYSCKLSFRYVIYLAQTEMDGA